VDDSGTAKITDIRLSKMKMLSASTTGHRGYGTTYWTAPELLKNDLEIRDYSSDVYAFGITSDEIASHGDIPFSIIDITCDI